MLFEWFGQNMRFQKNVVFIKNYNIIIMNYYRYFYLFLTFSLLFIGSINVAFAQETTTTTTSPTTTTTTSATTSTTVPTTTTTVPATTTTVPQTTTTTLPGTTTTTVPQTTTTTIAGVTPTTPCPTPLPAPACGVEQYLSKVLDIQNCVTGYECRAIEKIASICPALSQPVCNADQKLVTNTDDKGCVIGYECRTPVLGEVGIPPARRTCPQVVQPAMDGAGNCKEFATPCDVPPGWSPVSSCTNAKPAYPTSRSCPDGKIVPCYQKGDWYDCDPCPLPENRLSRGCRQEVDKTTGVLRVICEGERQCPGEKEQATHKERCYGEGGMPTPFKDPQGCIFYDCKFSEGAKTATANPLTGYQTCPAERGVDEAVKKCKEMGLFPAVYFEGGCKVVKCTKRGEEGCREPTAEERMKVEDLCAQREQKAVKGFDGRGCPQFVCEESVGGICQKDIPKEAISRCQEEGGEVVVKRDPRGCVSYFNCIQRGDERDAYVEPVERVPEATELLSLAFKLESLIVDLDRLAKESDNIAEYYASKGSSEEGRFRRVSGMFDSIKGKVSEIKDKLKSRLESLTVDDITEVKSDLKYIKNVMMKDIVYVMLSSSEEVKREIAQAPTALSQAKAVAGKGCGSDGSCFDKAIRICQPTTFNPEGSQGPEITIAGLEGKACILKAVLPENQGPPKGVIPGINPPYEMTCRLDKYSLGVRGPEDILPYCTGSMAELAKKFGTGPNQAGQPGGPEVPGVCRGEECKDKCPQSPENAKKCLEHLGPFLPPDAKEGLKMIAEGKGGFGGPSRPQGGFQGGSDFGTTGVPRERREFVQPREIPQEFGAPSAGGAGGGGFAQPVEQRPIGIETRTGVQPCSGCLNNGICDPGECSECADCLR